MSEKSSGKLVNRRTALKTMGVALAAAGTSFGFPGILRASDTLTIGCPIPLTGEDAIIGLLRQTGMKMAVREINEAGGADGREVKVIFEDTVSKSKQTIEKTKKLVHKDKVDVVIGGESSFERQAVMSVTKKAKKLYLYPNTYEGLVCEPYYVCVGLIPNQQIEPFAPWITKNIGKKIYLVGSDYIWARTMYKFLDQELKKTGGEVVKAEYFPFGSSEFGPLIGRIKETKPDAVFNCMGGTEAITYTTQAFEFGLELPKLAPHFNELWTSVIGPEAMANCYTAGNYFMAIDNPQNKAFIKNMRKEVGREDAITECWSELTYSAAWMYCNAVAKAGTVDDLKVAKTMTQLTFNAPEGPMTVDPQCQVTRTNVMIAQAQKDGKFKIIENCGMQVPVEKGCNLAG